MTPPLNIEVWDKDGDLASGFSADDILTSVKIDLYDNHYLIQKQNLKKELNELNEEL
jgi:hypothetical protein